MDISFKELKKNRLTPAEKWVLEQIEGTKPMIVSSGNVDWFDKNCMFLFEQDFYCGYLFVSDDIWSVLEKQFGYDRDESKELLTNILYDYTNKGKLKINK